jgi:hypothetical protein
MYVGWLADRTGVAMSPGLRRRYWNCNAFISVCCGFRGVLAAYPCRGTPSPGIKRRPERPVDISSE